MRRRRNIGHGRKPLFRRGLLPEFNEHAIRQVRRADGVRFVAQHGARGGATERFGCAWCVCLVEENALVDGRETEVRKNNVTFIPGLSADDERAYRNSEDDN